jgi:hypothetical protein
MTRALTFVFAARVINGKPSQRQPSDEEIRSFKSDYGARPEVCVKLLRKLRRMNCRPRIDHLLWALCFIKTYATEDSLQKKFGTTRKTFRKHIWLLVPKIASLYGHVS